MTDCTHIPVGNILLQTPPFRFVDTLVSFEREEVETAYTVPAEGPLVEAGHLTEAGLVENMAQSSAARIGYLGQVKNLIINRLPSSGERLSTFVKVRQDIFGITLVDAEVRCGEETVATAAIKTALRDE